MASKGQARGSTLLALAIGLLPQAPLAPVVMAQSSPAQNQAAQSPAGEMLAAKVGIRVAPVILAEPEVETSINVQVGPDAAIPPRTFLRVRGLPLAAKLSDGHVVSPGVWAVPLAALPSLRLHAPLSSSGRTEIQLSLVGVDGGVLADAKSSLVVAPAWLLGSSAQRQEVPRSVPQGRPEFAAEPPPVVSAPVVEARTIPAVVEQPRVAAAPQPSPVMPPPGIVAPPAPVPAAPVPRAAPPQPIARPETQAPTQPPVVAALPPAATPARPAPPPPAARAAPIAPPVAPPPAATAAPQLSAADRERAEAMVQRGDTFWRQGNYAAARQFFRRAADMGLAAGALRMGATFDPVEISSVSTVGLTADPKEASTWYERARELGAPEASARLARMQSR